MKWTTWDLGQFSYSLTLNLIPFKYFIRGLESTLVEVIKFRQSVDLRLVLWNVPYE